MGVVQSTEETATANGPMSVELEFDPELLAIRDPAELARAVALRLKAGLAEVNKPAFSHATTLLEQFFREWLRLHPEFDSAMLLRVFLVWFGPQRGALNRLLTTHRDFPFHGFISFEETEKRLTGKPLGSYFFRISSRRPFTADFIVASVESLEGNVRVGQRRLRWSEFDERFHLPDFGTGRAPVFMSLSDYTEDTPRLKHPVF